MKKRLQQCYIFITLAFMYAPILILMLYSFNESPSRGKWGGFSLKWYHKLFQDKSIFPDVRTTILLAVFSSLIATVVGTIAAIGIHAMSKKKKAFIIQITNLPVLNSEIVTGVSLMILFTFLSKQLHILQFGFSTLLIAHVTFNLPYVILSVLPKLRQLDQNLYEAALDLGASPIHSLIHVILPQIQPGIITGLVFAFTLSLDDFVISYFTTGSGVSTLSIRIYSMARRGINPEINALSTILFLMVMGLLIMINKRNSIYGKNTTIRGE